MEAIYATERAQGQTLHHFATEVTVNVDRWIALLRKKRDQQQHIMSDVHMVNTKIRHALDEGIGRLSVYLDKDYPLEVKVAIKEELKGLELRKRVLESVPIHPVLSVSYDKYLETLEGIKRTKVVARSGANRSPLLIEMPNILTTKTKDGGWKQPFNGDFSLYVLKKSPRFPMTLLAYTILLKAEYPRYCSFLARCQEKELVVSVKRFNDLLDETINELQAYDILDTGGNRGGGYLYVYTGRDSALYVRPTIGEYGYLLPAEAIPMLKRFHVHTHDDLETLYAGKADVHGIAPTNEQTLTLFLGDKEDEGTDELYLEGHLLYASRQMSRLSKEVSAALKNDRPIPATPSVVQTDEADHDEDYSDEE